MIAVDAVLDSQRAAYLDCGHGAMAHADGEAHLIERLKAGDPDALEPLMAGHGGLDQLRSGGD
jgi:hypothetical protein